MVRSIRLLLMKTEDKIAGDDTIEFDESITAESNVIIYSVNITGDVDEDTIESMINEDFPIAIVQG